jgi:hypothetical protein
MELSNKEMGLSKNKEGLSIKVKQEVGLCNSKELTESNTSVKLIKVGKRRQQTTITLKILSNRGHPSLVGLTSIQIYNTQAHLIPIHETHLRSPSPKLLRLFADTPRPEGWLTVLSGATVILENIGDAVGGMRVVNWNRS